MKKLLIAAALLLFCAPPGSAAVPACRSVWSSNSFANNSAATNAARISTIDFFPPWTSLANNAILLRITSGNSTDTTVSATDDKGNTYVAVGTKQIDPAGPQQITYLLATNTTAGVTHVTVSFTAGTGLTVNFAGGLMSECNNISTAAPATAVDTSGGNQGNSTSASCAQTTGTANDYIDQFAELDNTSTPTQFTWAPQGGFSLLMAGDSTWMGAQSEQQGAAGAITSTLTLNNATNWVTSCIAIKTAASGTAFPSSGLRIVCIEHEIAASGSSGNITLQATNCPSANLGILLHDTGPSGPEITAVADGTNTWVVQGSCTKLQASGAEVQIATAINFNGSANLTLTLTRGAGSGGSAFVFLGIAGASTTSPFQATPCQTASGNQVGAGTLALATITPTQVGSLVIAHANWFLGSANGFTGVTGGIFITSTSNLPSEYEPNGMDQNGFSAYVVTTGLGAITFSATEGDALAHGNWAANIIEVLAPAGGSSGSTVAGPTKIAGGKIN